MAGEIDEIFMERQGDRRVHRALSVPPYQTAEGTVLIDRRRHLDRRANWIGECVIEAPDMATQSGDSLRPQHADPVEMPDGAHDNC